MPLPRLVMPHPLFARMVTELARVAPDEGCGLIATHGSRAVWLYPGTNVARSPVRYMMEPGEVLRALLEIEASGWALGAIYHSHPAGPARPSATDLREAFYPGALMVIVSLADPARPQAAAFALVSGAARPAPLIVD